MNSSKQNSNFRPSNSEEHLEIRQNSALNATSSTGRGDARSKQQNHQVYGKKFLSTFTGGIVSTWSR